jgi:hypothetical protein
MIGKGERKAERDSNGKRRVIKLGIAGWKAVGKVGRNRRKKERKYKIEQYESKRKSRKKSKRKS